MYRRNAWKSSARFRTRLSRNRLPVLGFSTPKRVRRALLPVTATRACWPFFVQAERRGGNSRTRLSSPKSTTVCFGSARMRSSNAALLSRPLRLFLELHLVPHVGYYTSLSGVASPLPPIAARA
jgi:hypothetical protein